MAHSEFDLALTQIAEEKGISKDEIIEMIEVALAAAFRKDYGTREQNPVVHFDPVTLSSQVFDVKVVTDDEELLEKEPNKYITLEQAKELDKKAELESEISNEITPAEGTNFGRIAAQTAKQVIMQKLREAERNVLFRDYKTKERTIVNGVVQRLEGKTVLLDLGKATGVLFPSEQIKGETYRVGQRLKALILHVEPSSKGPKITLSRSHTDIVRRLFELEVPEIYNGVVEIKSLAREAGSRTKIAVYSTQEGVDPIGACVGQRGTRVQTITAELGGEKLDIIEWSEDPVKFIANALSPAKILSVQLDEDTKEAKVTVLEDQQSLAIGRAGQNVRLAARLTDWKIDILGEQIDEEGEKVKTEVGSAEPSEIEEAPDTPPEEQTPEGQEIEEEASASVDTEEEAKHREQGEDQPLVGEDTVVASEGEMDVESSDDDEEE